MLGPFTTFADLDLTWRERCAVPSLPDIELISRPMLLDAELHKEPEFYGDYLCLPQPNGSRKYVGHTALYSLVAADEVTAGVRAHIAEIAKHGPGRVWFLDGPAHLVIDDGMAIIQAPKADMVPRYLLRTFYGHEAQAV